ncbi:NfeD family protein [Pedomonas mirosovicensis]|uniref:NfeD family protein n=1 Tax=Pedomonas mirosovicensis TaxID=2908641 RepID=UPI00216A8335|nr:nodulation protein NfeD [Pedomonas mirosovicensis]MCH8686290.1 nodulation protein NfeD [Pedomonas mirosovicensis]
MARARVALWVRQRWGLAALALLLLSAGFAAAQGGSKGVASRAGEAVALHVDGAIGPATADYLSKGMAAARDRRAALLILRIDTPGGLDTVMRAIIRNILASPIPVACYVSPSGARAASAGTFILYACHVAAMAPGTNVGAATPVAIGGGGGGGGRAPDDDGDTKQGSAPSAGERKAINDAVAYIRSLADLRGRNADWAEQAVREAASLPAEAALQQGVIDVIARDMPDLLAQIDGREVLVEQERRRLQTAGLALVELAPDWRTRALGAITDPNIAYLLLMVGLYGLIFEFLTPGTFVPGVIGGLCLLVGLFALNLLPINTAGILLLLAGIGLLVAEGYAASFGILGIGGIAAIAVGSLLLFDAEVPGFALSRGLVLAVTVLSAGFLALVARVGWRAHRRRAAMGDAALHGTTAQVLWWSGNRGEVLWQGERWQAHASQPLAPGQVARVQGREGLVLFVEAAAAEPGAPVPPSPGRS